MGSSVHFTKVLDWVLLKKSTFFKHHCILQSSVVSNTTQQPLRKFFLQWGLNHFHKHGNIIINSDNIFLSNCHFMMACSICLLYPGRAPKVSDSLISGIFFFGCDHLKELEKTTTILSTDTAILNHITRVLSFLHRLFPVWFSHFIAQGIRKCVPCSLANFSSILNRFSSDK